MDSEVLDELTDCKRVINEEATRKAQRLDRTHPNIYGPCHWWYEIKGECIIPNDIKCRYGVPKLMQESSYSEFRMGHHTH